MVSVKSSNKAAEPIITKAIIWLMETNELPEECKKEIASLGLNPSEIERDIRKLTDAIADE